MSELFHFTCFHSAKQIGRYGIIIPRPQLTLGGQSLSWFTDRLDLPREALGLTSHTIACDRTEFVYRVLDPEACEPFLSWSKRTGNFLVCRLIDNTKRPEHWFIAEHAVRARLLTVRQD